MVDADDFDYFFGALLGVKKKTWFATDCRRRVVLSEGADKIYLFLFNYCNSALWYWHNNVCSNFVVVMVNRVTFGDQSRRLLVVTYPTAVPFGLSTTHLANATPGSESVDTAWYQWFRLFVDAWSLGWWHTFLRENEKKFRDVELEGFFFFHTRIEIDSSILFFAIR